MLRHLQNTHLFGAGVTKKILRLLEPLNRSESGASIYNYIEQTLCATDANCREAEETYAGLLTLLLDTVARQLPNGSPLQVQLKLLEVRLTPPFTGEDIAELRAFLDAHVEDIARGVRESDDIIEVAIGPLLESFNIRDRTPVPVTHEPAPAKEMRAYPERDSSAQSLVAERRVDVSYRRHLDEKRQGIQRIQQTLAQQLAACGKNNKSFVTLLERNLQLLQNTEDQENLAASRNELIASVENIMTEQQSVAQKLEEAKNVLGMIECDTQQLSDELTRIHLLSLTDDLTSLPNRRAFLRRLQDEVSRVQRYGNPLSLALIDIDGFKNINDKLGHAAGDEVLRVVANEILSIFRHHDLVARYGGEEFAVLLPNTQLEGALRALRKVHKHAQEATFHHDNSSMPLPTFSAGLTLYRPGESPETFIQRADHALYRAKELGRNRIESDQLDAPADVPSSMA